MSPLWTAAEAAAATGGQASGAWEARGVSIDSRTLEPGDLFVALSAARDGHGFVADALAKGAAAAMVEHRPPGVPEGAPLLLVDEVQAGLEALGRAARQRARARVVGITGSVGKTSVKEMLRTVLSRQGETHAAEKSYNNHWGVPLTLARMPRSAEFAVIEIGMNAPGEIAPLARMARLDVAVVTSVAAAHLAAFESLEGIAREKASILEGLAPGGPAVLNADVSTTEILQETAARLRAQPLLFGEAGRDYRLEEVRVADAATVVRATLAGTPALFRLAVPGRHFALNALACLAAVDALGADTARAAVDLGLWAPPSGRGTRERIVLDPVEDLAFELIDDAYNANPASLAAALEVLAAATPNDGVGRVSRGRRIAILGDMLELGRTEAELHAAFAEDRHLLACDLVHCVGPRMAHLWQALPPAIRGRHATTAEDLAAVAARLVDAGDVVLAKGSLGSRVSRVVDALRKLGHPGAPGT